MTEVPWIAVLAGSAPARWAADALRALAEVAGPPRRVLVRPRTPGWPDAPALAPDTGPLPGPAPEPVHDPAAVLRQHPEARSVWLDGAAPPLVGGETWWIGFGEPDGPLGATPGLRQIAIGTPCSRAALVRHRHGRHEVVVDAITRTVDVSVPRQLERVLAVATELPVRAYHAPAPATPAPRIVRGDADWSRWTRRAGLVASLSYAARQVDDTVRADVWGVGIIDAPIERMLDHGFRPAVRWLPDPPPGTFLADPFGVALDDGMRVYAEALDLVQDVGIIVSTDIANDGTLGPWCERLWRPEHLSYPFPLLVDGELHIIPECAASRTVTAWKTDDDGNLHEPTVLLDGMAALDASIVWFDGRWWMFATDAEREPVNALHVFYADHPLGPWTAHAANPVKIDVRSTRPAGTPFVVDGVLYRPAQDCSTGYGAAVSIERIDELTPTTFAEHTVRRLLPDAARPQGMHTLEATPPARLNAAGGAARRAPAAPAG